VTAPAPQDLAAQLRQVAEDLAAREAALEARLADLLELRHLHDQIAQRRKKISELEALLEIEEGLAMQALAPAPTELRLPPEAVPVVNAAIDAAVLAPIAEAAPSLEDAARHLRAAQDRAEAVVARGTRAGRADLKRLAADVASAAAVAHRVLGQEADDGSR